MPITGNLLSANAESIETDASAWSGLVNASGLARGSGGTLGSYCLLWKATAAGDSQVGLASRVSVSPNTEYWSCASVYPPVIGAQAQLEIRWYTSSGTLISTSQGPPVVPSATAWFQVAAMGTSPSNAATALVVLHGTATAANQSWYADRVFLGLPTPYTGNLLPWNTEQIEADTSGWIATSLCTLAVSKSSNSWYQAMEATATGAGSMVVSSVVTPAVIPGVEYSAHAFVTPGTAGRIQKVQIHWLNASGSVISVSSKDWTLSSGQWTKCVVIGTAPVGTATARVVLSPQATAAGQQWIYDRISLSPASALMTEGNLLPYNVAEMEQDISGWTVTGATASQSADRSHGGSYSMKCIAAGGDMVITTTAPVAGVKPGFGYQFAPRIYRVTDRGYQTRIEWLNADGAAVRARWQSWAATASTGETWKVGPMGDIAPDNAVSVRLSVIVQDVPVGETWYLDRMEWKLGGLTATAAIAGGGGAAITVRGLATGGPTWKWSLERVIAGVQPQPVRGWAGDLLSQVVTGDIAVATDYEAPLGVPVQWRVSIKDPSGPGAYNYTSDPISIDAEATDVWLTDPGQPARSARITVSTPMPTWQRAARQGVNHVRGRARPVVISDARAGVTGDLAVVTETDADVEALWWVLETGNVLLLRWPPGWGQKDMYVSVGDVSAAPIVDFAEFHDRTWTLPLTEVDRPIGGVIGSADRTWQTVKDSGSTWAEVLAGAASWLDIYQGT
ncbi:hypothetical protein [Streptomyces sp. NPDC086782]|uniref:hypothetical protein n=1 Tax=Streptomyces sp. NPDC086782 TaxID=3365757 RepID=UPI00380A3C93